MPVVTIEHVSELPCTDSLLGASIDSPSAGDATEIYSFALHGWAVGKSASVETVQVLEENRVILDVPLNAPRPDVALTLSLPDPPAMTGFQVVIKALDLPPTFELLVRVGLGNGTTAPVARIRGRRQRLPSGDPEGIQPLMITTLGRSGSKWLAWLLSMHQDIVAFRPLVFEPRVATYWTAVLRGLTAPASYLRQVHTESWQEHLWWLGEGERALPAPVDPMIAYWLGRDAIESLAATCRGRIEAFYAQVAKGAGNPKARYFVEKFLVDPVLLELISEVYPGARELILVRDFRDRLSSVLAWNRERGSRGFGRDTTMTDAEYVTERVRQDADALLRRWRARAQAAHLVRYEDLVLEPERTLAGILRYLALEPDHETVQGMIGRASRETSLLDAHRTVDDPRASIGRWRRDLPPDLAELSNIVFGPALNAFGYSCEADPVPPRRD